MSKEKSPIDFSKITETVTAVRQAINAFDQEIDQLAGEVEALRNAPLPRAEVLRNVLGRLDREAAEYEKRLQHTIEGAAQRAVLNSLRHEDREPSLIMGWDGGVYGFLPGALVYLLKDAITTVVKRKIETMPWPGGKADGLSEVERERKIAELEQRLNARIEEKTRLVEEFAAAGAIVT